MEISPCCCRVPRVKGLKVRVARAARLIRFVQSVMFPIWGVDVPGSAVVISLAIATAMFLILLIKNDTFSKSLPLFALQSQKPVSRSLYMSSYLLFQTSRQKFVAMVASTRANVLKK